MHWCASPATLIIQLPVNYGTQITAGVLKHKIDIYLLHLFGCATEIKKKQQSILEVWNHNLKKRKNH